MCHCKGWHPLAVFLYSKDLEHLRICLWIPWKTNSKMHLKMAQKGRPLFVFHLLYHPSIFFWTILDLLLFHFREGIFNSQKVTWIDFFSGVCPPPLPFIGRVWICFVWEIMVACSWNIFQARSEPIQNQQTWMNCIALGINYVSALKI